jgi:hypothetical protein
LLICCCADALPFTFRLLLHLSTFTIVGVCLPRYCCLLILFGDSHCLHLLFVIRVTVLLFVTLLFHICWLLLLLFTFIIVIDTTTLIIAVVVDYVIDIVVDTIVIVDCCVYYCCVLIVCYCYHLIVILITFIMLLLLLIHCYCWYC